MGSKFDANSGSELNAITHALLLQSSDDAFDHAILLRAMRRDELLLQPVTTDQRCVTTASEH